MAVEHQKANADESTAALGLLLTVEEVAGLLRLSKKGIYAMVEARRIPFVKISNRLRFLKSDVLDWLSENRVSALEEKRR
jgi:excisionase family DNA binding protein